MLLLRILWDLNPYSSKRRFAVCALKMVRAKGFEPLHLAALDPKSSVSAVPPRPHNEPG